MKNFEFKSQICTTREQSERLLALGLQKETADMEIEIFKGNNTISGYVSKGYWENEISDAIVELIPAWSLHRLFELMYKGDMFGFVGLTTHNENIDTIYELVIANIEGLIKIDKFNKDYLEEEK